MLRYAGARVLYPLAERRLGRQIRAKADALRHQMAASFAERRAWVGKHLAAHLQRAASEVPYYRDLFRQFRFDPLKLADDLAYLQDLPYLTKDIVREQAKRLISERMDPAALHPRESGGSTGPSLRVYYSQEALDWTAAVNIVSLEWAGKRPFMREMHLSSRFPETFPWRDRLKERVKEVVLNRANLFTDHFDPPALDNAWRAIRRTRPYLIQGHPSTLYALATRLRDTGVNARNAFDVFESTGEVLDTKKREVIETVFGCRAIDRYGNAEFGVLAHERLEDPQPRLKVLDTIAWPEVAKREGRSELVFTDVRNHAMPLVRYRTGDLADLEMTDEGFFLRNLVGRVHDIVRIGEHHFPTHYVQDLLDRIGGIDEFQVVQQDGPSLLRLVVPEVARHEAISRRIHSWWGDAVQLEFTDFGGLARRGWRSKFSHLVDSPSIAAWEANGGVTTQGAARAA
jgi:phenylacetate-CoA ligase